MLNERAASRPASPSRAMHTMQELADRNDTDRALLFAEQPIDLRRTDTVLEVDQQVGVNQEGHEGSGGATVLRSSRRSAANSSSGGGAVSISSRNRSADNSRVFGGVIVATGAPARVTSTSSPAATRLSTSEKERAASVAVIRDTTPAYQINQIGRATAYALTPAGARGDAATRPPGSPPRAPHRRRTGGIRDSRLDHRRWLPAA